MYVFLGGEGRVGCWHFVIWQTSVKVSEENAVCIFKVEVEDGARYRQQVPSERSYPSANLFGITSQKTIKFIFTAVRT
jgi:hypothetical protein